MNGLFGVFGAFFIMSLYRFDNECVGIRRNQTMEDKYLRLNLQHFSDKEDTEEQAQEENNEQEQDEQDNKITLTQEELDKKLESESDKKLEKALKTAKEKWEQEYQERLEYEKKEAERLAKLSAKERQEEELTKREEQLEQRLKDLERRELKSDAVADLKEKGLPAEFADFLLGEDAEETLENINNLKKTFDDAVNHAIKEKLKQDVPDAGDEAKELDPFKLKMKKYN